LRRYGKVDANHKDIADAFRKMGCSFLSLAPLGKGAPDAAIGYGGLTVLVEIKDGAKPKSAQKLTPDQETFWDTWKGGVRLVNGMEAAIETVELLKRWQRSLSC
jgi:hypothetical protein